MKEVLEAMSRDDACRSVGLQLFESIKKKQEAEALKLIDREHRSVYMRDANRHGYAIHHAVYEVSPSPLVTTCSCQVVTRHYGLMTALRNGHLLFLTLRKACCQS